jgi:transcriptional regulator with PAS, ATPase and Fis domain
VLAGYDWPGNVRELRNVLERAAILAQPDGRIDAELLRTILGPARREARADTLNLRERLERLERELVEEALARSSGSRKEGAKLLGVDPKNMSYYLKKHGLGGGA